jgi:hypothetical protein
LFIKNVSGTPIDGELKFSVSKIGTIIIYPKIYEPVANIGDTPIYKFDLSGTSTQITFSPDVSQNYFIPIYFLESGNYTLRIEPNNNTDHLTFSCFLPTTRILMADNTYKQISKIKQGESIRGLSGITRRVIHA